MRATVKVLKQPQLAAFRNAYHNPVNRGDFPDPSVIRVGKRTFYAVTSSTDWAPFFPIFRSFDLITWTIVGHVFFERPAWCVGSFWAPDFAERDGRFHVYYTARRHDGTLCVAVAIAERPEGPYMDYGPLVGQRYGSIDAMSAEDERGARWLLWKEDGNSVFKPTPIWAQRLCDAGKKLVGEPIELIRNDAPWEEHVVEAPHVIQRDGWFYMFYSGNACCGDDCAYAVGVARARTLAGPWEKHAHNPILAGNEAFRCPGHGSPVSDAEGRWYYVYHAYERSGDSLCVGRQLCVDAIEWDEAGWPSINRGRGPSRVAAAPFGSRSPQQPRHGWRTTFGTDLDAQWQWPQSRPPKTERTRRGLRLIAVGSARPEDPAGAVIARRLQFGDCVATARVDKDGLDRCSLASLCVYGSGRDALGIGVRGERVVVWRRRGGRAIEVAHAALPAGRDVQLRCNATGGLSFRFAYRAGDGTWTALGERFDGAWLPQWDTGLRIALAVGGRNAAATFRSLEIALQAAPVTVLARLRRTFPQRPIFGRLALARHSHRMLPPGVA